MTHPTISGVAIDTLLFSRIGSPLFHRYRIINHTGTHAAFQGTYICDGYMHFWMNRIQQRQHRRCAKELAARMSLSSGRDGMADVPSRPTVSCRSVSRARRPRKPKGGGGDSSKRSESVCLPASEASTIQALMELALPCFAGLGDGPRQVHLPWMVSADPPASPAACRLYTCGEEDRVPLPSPCLNLDELSSSDDDTGESVGLSDLSITLLCDSDEILTPVNSDQVLSDVDLPIESVSHDKRQVIRIRDVSQDVQIVDASQVGRAWNSRSPVSSVASGKRMPGKVSMAISRAPLSLDMTVTCTSGVAPASAHSPAVTSNPAMSTATITSIEVDVSTRSSDVAPVPGLEPVSFPVGERVPALELSSPPLSELPDPVPVVESEPAVNLPSSPLSGQSSPVSSQTLAWGDAGDSSVPLSPNRVQAGAPRTFRTKAVGFMCRRFRQDFCFGHRGLLSSFRRMGSCCRRRWTISVIRFLVTR